MEDHEKEELMEQLKSKNHPVEEWSIKELKREVNGDGQGQGQSKEIDDIGIE